MAQPNALVRLALGAAVVVVLTSACGTTEAPRDQPSPRSVVYVVLPEAVGDSDPYQLQVHLGASLALFKPVEFSLRNGRIELWTTSEVGSARRAGTETVGGLRIIEYRFPSPAPSATGGPGNIRYTVDFDAADLANRRGELEQPAVFAVRRAALASRKESGTVVLLELSHAGGGRFRAVTAVR